MKANTWAEYKKQGFTVEDYPIQDRKGKHIRKATRVIFPSQKSIEFIDRFTSKALAVRQAIAIWPEGLKEVV